MKKINIAVIGVGGVGGLISGKLLECEFDNVNITLIARGEHLKTIQSKGLKIVNSNGESIITSPHDSFKDIDRLENIDIFIIAVKAYNLNEICNQIKNKVAKNTIILPLMNGMDIYERIRSIIDKGIIIPSCIYISSRIEKPGVIKQISDTYKIILGPDKQNKEFIPEELLNILENCKLSFEWTQYPMEEIWRKYIFIASFSLVTSVNNATLGEVLENDELVNMTKEIMKEIYLVAKNNNINLDTDVIEESIEKARTFPFDTKTSLHRDILKRKKNNELNIFAVSIIELAEHLNIEVPNIKKVYDKLK